MGSHRRPICRKVITRVTVSLLLGAIVNVAVAWGCVLALPPRYHHPSEIDDERQLASDEATAMMLRAFPDAPIARDETYAVCFGRFGWQHIDAIAMPEQLQPNDSTSVFLEVNDVIAGWPSYGLFGRFKWDDRRSAHSEDSLYGLICVPDCLKGQSGPRRLIDWLPFAPLWPGFAINTLFYAVVLWGLFAAPFALRRRRRIKRGLCPKCAYTIGTNDVCTECGATLPSPSR